MRWGGAAQICCLLFTNCIYWVHLGMGREGETPAQFFFGTLALKKVVQVVQIKGRERGGGSREFGQSQNNSYFLL